MKKIAFVLILLCLLTACASTNRGIDTSSNCKYEVDGLECKREQVWQMRDNGWRVFEINHTEYWFESFEDCNDYRKDEENQDVINSSPDSKRITSCGYLYKDTPERTPDFINYYIYSDGKQDADYYYMIESSFAQPISEGSKKKEYFTPMFTSKDALDIFKQQTNLSNFKRVIRRRVKRMY